MKVQFLKEFSFIIEKDGEEIPVTTSIFNPGEAFITKDDNGDYYLQFRSTEQCDWVKYTCSVLNYDTQRQHSFPGVRVIQIIGADEVRKHVLLLIAWNSNPAGLKLRVNGLPLHKIKFFEF